MSSNYHVHHSRKCRSESLWDPYWGPAKWRSHSTKYSTQCLQLGLERQSYGSWRSKKGSLLCEEGQSEKEFRSTIVCLICLMWFVFLCSPAIVEGLKTLVRIRSSNHYPTNIDFGAALKSSCLNAFDGLVISNVLSLSRKTTNDVLLTVVASLVCRCKPCPEWVGRNDSRWERKGMANSHAAWLYWSDSVTVLNVTKICVYDFFGAIAQATQKNKLTGHNRNKASK